MKFVNVEEVEGNYKNILESEQEEKNDHKNTFVGTAEYVSPEVLVDRGAGPAADLWALGCIIYQMFAGFSPFKDKTEYLVFKRILENKYTFPSEMSDHAIDLIKALLVNDPDSRLGAGKEEGNNMQALKMHPFFSGLDFNSLNIKEPPHKSEFKSKVIKTSNTSMSQADELSRHKNTIQVIKQDIIDKKSPWLHYNTRKVVLDNTPKIEYIEPSKNIVKVI
jgi:3-phosphoinositide dependent protein kinase-1